MHGARHRHSPRARYKSPSVAPTSSSCVRPAWELLPNCRAQDVRIAATGRDGTVRTDSAGFALNLQGVSDAEPEAGADTRHGRVVPPPVLQRNDRDPPTYR